MVSNGIAWLLFKLNLWCDQAKRKFFYCFLLFTKLSTASISGTKLYPIWRMDVTSQCDSTHARGRGFIFISFIYFCSFLDLVRIFFLYVYLFWGNLNYVYPICMINAQRWYQFTLFLLKQSTGMITYIPYVTIKMVAAAVAFTFNLDAIPPFSFLGH